MNIPNAEDISDSSEVDTGEDAQQPVETFQQPRCSNCGFSKFQLIGIEVIENPVLHLLCLNCGLYIKISFNPVNKEITKSQVSPSYAG